MHAAGENDDHLVTALLQQMQKGNRVCNAAVYIVFAVQFHRFADNGQGAGSLDRGKQPVPAAVISEVCRFAVLAAGRHKIGLHGELLVNSPVDAAGVLLCHVIQIEESAGVCHMADPEVAAVPFHDHHFQ